MPWTKLSSRLCRPGDTFSSLARAQTACLQLGSSCHGVYDAHCDTRKFSVCAASPYSTSHGAGCVYHKLTTSLPVKQFTPTTGAALRNAAQTCLANSPKGNCARCFFTKTEYVTPGTVHDIIYPEDLQRLQATGKLVVVDWYAHSCGRCQAFASTFQIMAEQQTDVLFCTIEVGETDELAEYISEPTFQLFVGEKDVASFQGADEPALQRLIDQHNPHNRPKSDDVTPGQAHDITSEPEVTPQPNRATQPNRDAKKSLPTSVKDIQRIMVDDMKVPPTVVQGVTEKDDLIELYVKQFSLKEMQALLKEHGVSFTSFLERSDYNRAVTKLVRDSMNK